MSYNLEVTNQGLKNLAGMALQYLFLDYLHNVTSKGLGVLEGMPIEHLNIGYTAVDNAALPLLLKLPLRDLGRTNTKMKGKALDELGKRFPKEYNDFDPF